MRLFIAACSLLAASLSAFGADLRIDVKRNGFTGSIGLAVAPRIDGRAPEWSPAKTLAPAESTVTFTGLEEGLYAVMASGPQPLERLSTKVNLGADGSSLHLAIPKTKTSLRVTLAGRPLGRAMVLFTEDELRWDTELETKPDGRFDGALWQPGLYTASVRQDRATAPHLVDVHLSSRPLTITVPDRSVIGHVLGDDGVPIAGATVILQSQDDESTLSVRATSAADGRFEFFGAREGAQSLSARAPSYLNSDASRFDLRGPSAHQSVDLTLTRGTTRTVHVVDPRGVPIAEASLFTACDGYVKSTTLTNAEGQAEVALPTGASCAIYALPKQGSIAAGHVSDSESLTLRVPQGTSSLRLALKSETGVAFTDLWLLMRIDGIVVPPAVARQFVKRGFALLTDPEGRISLAHIPPGTYEFWPYRTEAEGQTLFEVAQDFAAPISVNVLTGENDATVRFKAKR